MASEYLKWKAQQEAAARTPEEPVVYTRQERIANWFHYHWMWLLVGAVLVLMFGTMLWNILGIGRVKPDYTVACVTKEPLSEEHAASLAQALGALGTDVNGDGKVTVEIRRYAVNRSGDAETVLYYNQAADTKLLADMTAGDSYFYLTDDPASLQRSYQILANPDGGEPDEEDRDVSDKVFPVSGCPALSGLDPALSKLFLGRRWYAGRDAEKHAADAAFWEVLTKGASH